MKKRVAVVDLNIVIVGMSIVGIESSFQWKHRSSKVVAVDCWVEPKEAFGKELAQGIVLRNLSKGIGVFYIHFSDLQHFLHRKINNRYNLVFDIFSLLLTFRCYS